MALVLNFEIFQKALPVQRALTIISIFELEHTFKLTEFHMHVYNITRDRKNYEQT